ncbi:hypothetical protein J7E98_30460, partial [Streptomyces sp. ISL-86]|nr:hypothetical protein [Streptomyces sp. ISL-86]
MSDAPVNPAEIPVFTGDLAKLQEKVKSLSGDGASLATAGNAVHTTFGGMSAYYKAPEAEQLFAVTKPVVDVTLKFSSDMCVIAGALGTYASDIDPLIKKLDHLREEAQSFKDKASHDKKWREDGDLIEENLDRRNEIAEVWAQFQTAERNAHAKIVALVGGKPLKVNDGSNGDHMYGYDGEALKASKSLPWGDAVAESVPWWQVWEHAYDFGKGVIVDGVWGTIKGLGTLVGFDGWDAAGQAWVGLGKLATGLVITSIPVVGSAYLLADDKDLPSWLRDSRTAMKETGKALLAWDQWSENPSRAAGAVTFNVVTTVFTGGAGGAASGAGKAGAAARAISLAGKVGKAIDPMTYVFKGAGAGLGKIGDVMAGLKGMGNIELPKFPDGTINLPEGSLKLPDGTVHIPDGVKIPDGAVKLPDGNFKLPEGTTALPPGTVRLPGEGAPRFMGEDGTIYKADGSVDSHVAEAPKDVVDKPGADGRPTTPDKPANPVTGADTPRVGTPAPARVPELAGVGGRGGDDFVRLGGSTDDIGRVGDHTPGGNPGSHLPGDLTPTGRAGDNLPGGNTPHTPGGGVGDHMPANSLDNTGTGVRPGEAVPGPRTDGPSTGGGGHDLPGGGAADNGLPRTDGPGGGATGPG